MRTKAYTASGEEDGDIELPEIFETPYRYDLIHKAYVILNSHKFQPKGTHPTAGQDVSADSLDPPTGHGQSRVARIRGGGRRQGVAAEVASTRGGRQAHPPKSSRVIRKRINKKESRLALCSAIAATASPELVRGRGHRTGAETLPPVISDDVEQVASAKNLQQLLHALGFASDMERLERRRARSGKSALRGRGKKTGKSVLFVARNAGGLAKACGSLPGVQAVSADSLSVLDLAPGAVPARLTVYTRGAIERISGIRSPHMAVMNL